MGQIGARRVATIRAPRLPASAGPWFNAAPLTGWRGVTLVDFWTYSCINCLRTLPALRAWNGRYAAHGLTILGVHTPEFSFEHESGNVARALRELGITYPVVLDNERAIWSAFANRAWPHRYLIDANGRIVHDHAGEGGEVATERALRAALLAGPDTVPLPTSVYPADTADWPPDFADDAPGQVCVPGSPELFAGYYRGVSGNPGGFREDTPADYTDPGGYREGYVHLSGRWVSEAEAARFVGQGSGALRLAFRGLAPNVVLAPPPTGMARVGVRIDRADAPGESSALATMPLDAPRLYRLPEAAWSAAARSGDPAALRLLTLLPETPGIAAYSFTFSACG
jgi:thiol-disulfide isomerase/thioredoxin